MANKEIITKAIADAVRELLSRKTIENITVTDICRLSGVNRRTFYRYFKDKYEIIGWIYSSEEFFIPQPKEGWHIWDYMPLIAKTLYSERSFYRNAFQFRGQNSFREYSISLLSPILTADYKDDFPEQKMLNFFIDRVCNLAFDSFIFWLSMDPCPSPEEFTKYFENAFRLFSETTLANIRENRKTLNDASESLKES